MVLVFRLFIGVYKAVLLKSRYCLDLVTGFVIFIRWQNSVFGTYSPIRESTYRIPNFLFGNWFGNSVRTEPSLFRFIPFIIVRLIDTFEYHFPVIYTVCQCLTQ